MTGSEALPWAILAGALLPGIGLFFIPEAKSRLRATVNLAGAGLAVGLIALAMALVVRGWRFGWQAELLPGVDFILILDPLGLLFAALAGGLWLLTTIYALGYMAGHRHLSRFFGFFSLSAMATIGIAIAGNLFTLFFFYEILTLATYPLIVHDGTAEARRVGRIYLAYTLAGSALVLGAAIWLQVAVGPLTFGARESAAAMHEATGRTTLILIFVMLIAGFGVKAAIVPLHAWLPAAMVAPTPVSALLHAVAVVKAGAFGIVRVVHETYGFSLVNELGLAGPLAIMAAVTILYGSLQALRQDNLKRRLAYSTVSQLSYIILGTALVGTAASIGGLVHLVHQGVMKITLFFCAGILAETLGVHGVRELRGAGRRLPLTMLAFTVGALGMMAAPPLAGFISEWYLGVGALAAGELWVLAVLAASSLLNALYFLPLVYDAWFRPPPPAWPAEHALHPRWETRPSLLVPTLATALMSVAFGLFAGSGLTPLGWAHVVGEWEFGPW